MSGFVVSLIFAVAMGIVLVTWLLPKGSWRAQLPLTLGLALGVGLGLSAATHLAWLLAFPATRSVLPCLEVALVALLGFLAWRRPSRPLAPPREAALPFGMWVAAAALGLAALNVATFVIMARRLPNGGWDALAMWNMKARFMFLGGEHWTDMFRGTVGHPDYPLLVPSAIARVWQYAGNHLELGQAAVAMGFTFGTVLLLAGGLRALRGAGWGWLGGLLLLGTPAFMKHGARQYADVPLAFYFLASIILLCLAAERPREDRLRLWLLAGLSAGLAAWTKNEGLQFVLVLLFVQSPALFFRGERRARLVQLVTVAIGMLPGVAANLYFKWRFAVTNDLVAGQDGSSPIALLLDPDRYALIAKALGGEVFISGEGLAIGLLLFLLIARPGRQSLSQPALLSGLAVMGGTFAGYLLVFMATPHDLAWHLSTALDRLTLQLWPGVLFLVLLGASGSPSTQDTEPSGQVPTTIVASET